MLSRPTVAAALAALIAACGSGTSATVAPGTPAGYSASTVTSAGESTGTAPINCDAFGGCDVQEDLSDGSQTIIPLRASFDAAKARAMQEAQRSDVIDAVVVGDAAPHAVLSQPFHH